MEYRRISTEIKSKRKFILSALFSGWHFRKKTTSAPQKKLMVIACSISASCITNCSRMEFISDRRVTRLDLFHRYTRRKTWPQRLRDLILRWIKFSAELTESKASP